MSQNRSLSPGMRRILKWLGIIAGCLLIFLAIVQVVVYLYADVALSARLKRTVKERSNGLYTLEIDDLRLNIFTSSLSARNIRLVPDTTISDTSKQNHYVFDVSIREAAINHVNLSALYLADRLNIGSIQLAKPNIVVIRRSEDVKKQRNNSRSLHAIISPFIKSLNIGSISVSDGSFHMPDHANDSTDITSIGRISFQVDRIQIGENDTSLTRKIPAIKSLMVTLDSLYYRFPSNFYALNIGKIQFQSTMGSLDIDSLSVMPRYSKYRFAYVVGKQTDRIKFSVNKIHCNDFDFLELARLQNIRMRSVEIDSPKVVVFRDKRVPQSPRKYYPKLPRQILRTLDPIVTIDSAIIHDGFISYSELAEKAEIAGTVNFEKIEASIENITNDTSRININPSMTMHANTMLSGITPLTADFHFALDDTSGTYTYEGNLDSMDLRKINPTLSHLAFIKVTSGMEDSLSFFVTGNNDSADGSMRLRYHGLQVAMLSKKGENPILSGIKRAAGTLITNNFVINENNPSHEGDSLIVGQIDFHRDKTQSIFNYWWKTLLTGFKSSMGM